jgi:CheY-like chemotaxis protein
LARRFNRPEEYDHLVVVADDEAAHREYVRDRLVSVNGRARAAVMGSYPRFRVLLARDGDEAIRLVTPEVSALMVDLVMPRRNGIDVIRELRQVRADLAILAYTAGAPPSEAVAAIMAGADHFLDYSAGDGFEHALDLALDRRRLALLIERNETEVQRARARLAELGAAMAPLPGLRPPLSADAILPFQEAARRYLDACARLFEGDPRGLAARLGLSYFALRRLLKRHQVPFPGRSRRSTSSKHRTGRTPL